jgi:hypothetical protein
MVLQLHVSVGNEMQAFKPVKTLAPMLSYAQSGNECLRLSTFAED